MRFRIKTIFIILLLICTVTANGQQYFGRNKVHYNQFKWQILKTPHFEIYYYPGMDSLAEIGAFYAENTYRYLQNKFNHNVLQRIPLVFYAAHFHFQETNTLPFLISPGLGGFFEFIKGRVVVPSDGDIYRFRHTIRHELVHVFMKSILERTLKDHRIIQLRDVPLWFTEGLAEYWSEGWTSDAEMIMRDLVLNNRLYTLGQMGAIWGSYLMYKEGQAILKFIAEEYGEDKILRLLQNTWISEDFSKVMKHTLDVDYKEFSDKWKYKLIKEIFPLMEKSDLPHHVTLKLTRQGYNTMPAFYRTKEGVPMAVFLANRDGYTSIYEREIVDNKRLRPTLVIRGEKSSDFESFHIQRSKLDVSGEGHLVFAAKSGPRDVLYLYDMHLKKEIRRFEFKSLISLFSPALSPDGSTIAMTGLDRTGKCDLYLVDVSSGDVKRLTNDYFDDRDPDWCSDGLNLVFSSDRGEYGRDGCTNIFSYNLADDHISALTSGSYHDRAPVCSPDGAFIAFSSDRDGVQNIYTLSSEDEYSSFFSPPTAKKKAKQLTHYATGGFTPCWTDSMSLLLTTFEKVGFHIQALSEIEALIEAAEPVEGMAASSQPAPWVFPSITGETTLSRVRYKRKFSLDIAQSQVIHDPIFGTSGGGQLLITDLMGDEQYYFLVYNSAQTRSEFWDGFNLAASRTDLSGRVNYSLGLYRLAGHYYNRHQGFFYERRYGGFFAVSYPFNVFERVETSINLRHSVRDTYATRRNAVPVSNFISYTRDNSLWGPTGPLDGGRYNIALGNTVDLMHSNVNFTTVMVDLRHYFRINRRMTHAIRIWGQFNHGKEALPFVMGGSWDLRGYRLWSLWGTKLALISNEFRFPFLDQLYLGFPFGGIFFSSIRGALFLDVGNVWDEEFGDLKGSFGFGLRLSLGGMLVLRLDVGKKTDFKQVFPRTFVQFFFGWDF